MKNQYEVRGDITVLFVIRKDGSVFEVLINTEDLPRYLALNKKIHVDKLKTGYYAKYHPIKHTSRMFHRFILDAPDNLLVDHIYHNTLDLRKSKLRLVTNAENLQNLKSARSDSTTGIRGVSHKGKLWVARAWLNGKEIRIGSFPTKEEAESAVTTYRKENMPFSQENLYGT